MFEYYAVTFFFRSGLGKAWLKITLRINKSKQKLQSDIKA